ncbi:MAG: 5'-nucleotidase C-terminal domain-containing protein [Ignavibacteriaceae bacterium]
MCRKIKSLLFFILLFFEITVNSQTYRLTILHNNDAKSKLIKPTTIGQEDFGGVSKFKTVVDSLKARATRNGYNVVTVSSGNSILAGPEFYISQQLSGNQYYFDSRAMDVINYDAIGFGNHEFDFGPDVTARFIHGFQNNETSFISSNLDFSQEDSLFELVSSGRIKRYKIVMMSGEKIGIIATISPELKTLGSPRNIGIDTNVVGIINSLVDTLTNQGVNKIILLNNYQGVKQDSLLIRGTRGIDIVVGGHDYEILANPWNQLVPGDESSVYGTYPLLLRDSENKPVYLVKTGPEYKYVGKLSVDFNSSGIITNISSESGPVRVAGGTNPDAVVPNVFLETNVIAPLQNSLNALSSNVIGTSEVELDGLTSNVRTKETNLGNLSADAMLWQSQQLAAVYGAPMPDIGLQNGGGIRINNILPAGSISEFTTFSIHPFPNFNSIVANIPPQQFKEIMENAVSRVETVEGRFLQVAGMKIIYNPYAQAQVLDNSGNVLVAGKRIYYIRLDNGTWIVFMGVVNNSAPSVTVAINDFLARGGDQFPFREAPVTSLGVTYQQGLAKYIQQGISGVVTSLKYPVGGEGRIIADPTAYSEENKPIVSEYGLRQNYPNPFNPSTVISYQLPVRSHVTLKMFDILGNEVATLVDEEKDSGVFNYQLSITDYQLSSGVYFYELRAGDFGSTKKMVLIK